MKNVNVTCVLVLLSVISSVLASQAPPCPTNYTQEAFFPDSDCTKYWQCSDGVAYLRPCPPNEYWDSIRWTCDAPAVAHCDGQGWSTIIPTTTTTSPVPITTPTTAGPSTTTTSPVPVTTQPTHSTATTTTTSPVPVTTPTTLTTTTIHSTASKTTKSPSTTNKATTTEIPNCCYMCPHCDCCPPHYGARDV